ncbi:MAG TPA: HNH endonuclease [Clostridiales bacterium]|nr:HNH endonuclease [Clostridiales bacterium]
MEVEYLEDGDLAIFNGRKYRRDKKTGYYLNSATHERLHRAVWECHKGEIPDGFHIHHIDEDKSNNEIVNLALLPGRVHVYLHGKERNRYHHDEMVENLEKNAVPKAAEWHGSEAGREWHSEHAKESAARMAKREYVCLNCGKKFYKKPLGENKFCSANCKAAYRRKSGVDDEIRTCVICGKEFKTNRYSKAVTCSEECRGIYRWRRIHQANRQGQRLQYGS